MASLHEKVAIVTGSSSGIGASIARRFAANGAHVVVNSARSASQGEQLASVLPGAIYVQGDVSDEQDATRLVQAALDEWGRLDVLVNSAGTTRIIPHDDLDGAPLDVWRAIFEINVFGPWLMSQMAVPSLRAGEGGSIINISSIAGSRCSGSSIPYAASKAALNHVTRLLAKVVGPEVRVNAIAPGLIETPWTADWDTVRRNVQQTAPLRRTGLPDEVADAAVSMATLSYLTGEVVAVDGGLSLVL